MVERILALMEERDIKASHLTKELSLSHGVVTQWKQGLQKPSTEAIVKLAAYFGVSTDFLLTGKEPYLWLKNKKEDRFMSYNFTFTQKNGQTVTFKGITRLSYMENGTKIEIPNNEISNHEFDTLKTYRFYGDGGGVINCLANEIMAISYEKAQSAAITPEALRERNAKQMS